MGHSLVLAHLQVLLHYLMSRQANSYGICPLHAHEAFILLFRRQRMPRSGRKGCHELIQSDSELLTGPRTGI